MNPPAKNRLFRRPALLAIGAGCLVGVILGLLLIAPNRHGPSATQRLVDEVIEDPVQFARDHFTGGIGVALAPDTNGLPKIFAVGEGTPAEAAGLQKDDIILKVNGKPTHGQAFSNIVAAIKGLSLGSVVLEVERGGTNQEIAISRASWDKLKKARFN